MQLKKIKHSINNFILSNQLNLVNIEKVCCACDRLFIDKDVELTYNIHPNNSLLNYLI